jgi:hypothetical protein
LRGIAPDDEAAQARLAGDLDSFALDLLAAHTNPPVGKPNARSLINGIISWIGRDRIVAAYPAYRQGGWLGKVIDAAAEHLHISAGNSVDWETALDTY